MKLVIGNKNYSSWSLRPWLLLKQFGVSFEEIQVSLRTEDRSTRLRQYSPAGKVPVLIDDKLTVWDSLAICEYVSEKYLNGDGWPADSAQRAEARSISAEMHSGFQALRGEMPMNCRALRKVIPSEAVRLDIDRIQQIWSACRTKYSRSGPWLFGDFSIADCMYAPVVTRFLTYGVAAAGQNRGYLDTVINNLHMRDWLAAAKQEQEILADSETGAET
jgi:glutathione S-transferase